MTAEEDKAKKEIINFLKKKYSMEAERSARFDLSEYSIIEKGALLKNIYNWKLIDFEFLTYFLSIRNSYKIEVMGTAGESMVTTDKESQHNALLIISDFKIPELIIRPAYLREKIANVFLNFDIKLNNRKEFNKKYILESSSDYKTLDTMLTKKLTNELIKLKEFSLEFKNNTILLKFEKEFNKKDSLELIEIGKIVESEIKNVVQQRTELKNKHY